jgi:molybdate transport system substrate-binding protein
VGKRGSYALIPQEWHQPLRQRMALIKGAGETAREFFGFIQTPPAREIFARYGFTIPEPAR